MDFFTSTIIGGMLYDVLKKVGEKSYYIVAKEVLKNFTQDEILVNEFAKILQESNINNKTSLKDIVKLLDANNKTKKIVQKVNTINNYYYGKNIIVNNYENKKRNIVLNPVKEKFRNKAIDLILLLIVFYLNLYFMNIISFGISIVFILIYVFYVPKIMPFMYIYVYEDKLVYLFNKMIMYKDIKNFKYTNSNFEFRINGNTSYKKIILYNNDNAEFIFDTIKRYSIFTDTLL